MSRKKTTAPSPVLASMIQWNTSTGPLPTIRLTGLTHTIYVGPSDLPRLEAAVASARAQITEQQAEQEQEVAA